MARKTCKKCKGRRGGDSLKPRTPSAERPTHRFTHRNRTVRNPNGPKQNSASKSRKNSPSKSGMCNVDGKRVPCNLNKVKKYKEIREKRLSELFPRD
jgi:hypothetical protein